MSMHVLNTRPLPTFFNGQWWLPQGYADLLEEQLRGQMRDKAALRGYMAEIRELWQNIPEKFAKAKYAQSQDAFRKHALIKTGWCEIDSIVFETRNHAVKAAETIGYRARMSNGYAITIVRDTVVYCSVPLSQSLADMSKEDFDQSKRDVLDWCRGIVGVGK